MVNKMPVIRIRFIASRGFVGEAIRWVTHSLFQHVEFGTSAGTWVGAHAGIGVRELPPDWCHPYREFIYEIPCTQQELDELMAWCAFRIGTKYNYWDIVGMLIRKRQWTSPHRLICSQFCLQGLLEVFGAPRVLNVLSEYAYLISPETLHLSPIFVGRQVKRMG